jgi:hypothetical protein
MPGWQRTTCHHPCTCYSNTFSIISGLFVDMQLSSRRADHAHAARLLELGLDRRQIRPQRPSRAPTVLATAYRARPRFLIQRRPTSWHTVTWLGADAHGREPRASTCCRRAGHPVGRAAAPRGSRPRPRPAGLSCGAHLMLGLKAHPIDLNWNAS